MKLVEQIERLKYIHELIEKQQTGTSAEFAKKLHISRRQLYNILEDLKIMGAPIEYDSLQRSYIYTQACEIRLSCDIKTLSKEELRNISGGGTYTTNTNGYKYYEFIKDIQNTVFLYSLYIDVDMRINRNISWRSE